MKPLLFLSSFCLALSPLAAATLEGILELPPSPPARKSAARYGTSLQDAAPPEPRVGVVYLEGDFSAEEMQPPEEPAILLQQGLRFRPNLLPIMEGGKVTFPNGDETYHNVFSYAPGNDFDLGRYMKDEDAPVITFDEAGVASLFCEIHSHMRGIILVLKSPYFTRTDAEGRFRLENVPAGEYTLVGWVSPREQYRHPVTVEADTTLEGLHLPAKED